MMMLRIGNCEAEVRVAAVMSVPRLGFTDNFFCVSQAISPHRIPLTKFTGAFWGQCLQRSMAAVLDDYDVVLTIDYDTVFTAKTVEAILTLLMHSGYDAIAPLQTKRESNTVMFAKQGHSPEDKTVVENDWFGKVVQPVETAHFGCTVIRTEAIKRMPKPWFLGLANDDGDYTGGHLDEDMYFWKKFCSSGNKLGIATQISVGHAELMITWPSREVGGGKVQQHTTEFWNSKTPPPGAWGYVP